MGVLFSMTWALIKRLRMIWTQCTAGVCSEVSERSRWGRMLKNRLLRRVRCAVEGSGEGKVWGKKGRRVYNKTLKAVKARGMGKHVWACIIPSSLFLSSLPLCLSASILWNSTAIAWRLVDITGCPGPHLISIHTCPLSPEAQGKAYHEQPWPYSTGLLHHIHWWTSHLEYLQLSCWATIGLMKVK